VDARPGSDPSASYLFWPPSFGEIDGHVVFFALAPTPYDHEPWVTTVDGDGASLLADLNQQSWSAPQGFTELAPDLVGVGDAAFWTAGGDENSLRPWRTRGQVAGAAPLPAALGECPFLRHPIADLEVREGVHVCARGLRVRCPSEGRRRTSRRGSRLRCRGATSDARLRDAPRPLEARVRSARREGGER